MFIFGVLGGGVLLVIILVLVKRRQGPQTAKGLAEAGNYLAAAMQAKKEGKLEVAMEYFLIARQPVRAAGVARMLGRHEQAAEMLESAGELERAAALFEEAGLKSRARELREQIEARGELSETSNGDGESDSAMLSDADHAARLDRTFKETLANADRGSVEAQAELLEVGREAAEACLAAGETQRAAEIFRDSGLVDQAINLYVNLLGEFGEAAALMSKRGDHDRAAELYEQAGQKERALGAWIKWAEDASDPLEHILAVDRLGDSSTNQLLDTIIDNRPLANDTVDLHYRVAEAYEERDEYKAAVELFQSIQDTLPGYRDVERRLDNLEIIIREGGKEERIGGGAAGRGDNRSSGSGGGGWSNDASPGLSPLPSRPAPHGERFNSGSGRWNQETRREDIVGPDARDSDGNFVVQHNNLVVTGQTSESQDAEGPSGEFVVEGNQIALPARSSPKPRVGEDPSGEFVVESHRAPLPARPSPRPAKRGGKVPISETEVGLPVDLEKGNISGARGGRSGPSRSHPDDFERAFGNLKSAAFERMVQEVVSIAVIEAQKQAQPQPQVLGVSGRDLAGLIRASSVARSERALARGLESQEIRLKLVADPKVEAARDGPTVRELKEMMADAEPSLQNIEVWYRLGLAYAAGARWTEALEAFKVVEDISPGYRDALDRADELEQWRTALTSDSRMDQVLSDRYTLLGELGRGGMAVVYRARDEALGREVALKFLSEEVSAKPGMMDLFQREARAAAQMTHPNIVTVYDVGVLTGRAFIAMELVTGQTVEEILDELGKLRVMEALGISENILSALEYAHSKQIVHRDVKPSNMMKGDTGVIKLMDFGLAKSFGGGDRTTAICGTPLYMAPEQFTGKNIDAQTDLFAFGATLYEMLTGQPPFEDMSRDRPPPSLREFNPSVPEVIDAMVLRSLKFRREDRFASATEMLEIVQFIIDKVSKLIGKTKGGK